MQSYSAALCANFSDLKSTNRVTLDSFATLLLSYLRFRAQTTANTLITTADNLCKYFNCGKAILRNALEKLTNLGVVTIKITSNQKGYKRTAITVLSNENSFFNYEKLSIIRQYTKDDDLSLLYGFVAYKLSAYDKLNQPKWVKEIDGKIWWQLDVERIASQFNISERTAFRNLNKLLDLGLLIKRRVGLKTYYAINDEMYKAIADEHKELLINKRPKFDFGSKFTDTSEVSSINNTSSDEREIYINNNTRDSDIILNNFDSIGKDLSKRQIAYLLAAIKTTMQKYNIRVSEGIQSVFGWIKFSILNPCQRKGITDFKHAVNRFIKLLRDKKLTEPFGYRKHTEEGRQFWEGVIERETRKANAFVTSEPQAGHKQSDIVYEGSFSIDDETWQNMMDASQEQIDRTAKEESARVVLGEMSNKETDGGIMQETVEERDKRLLNEKAERFARALASKSKDESANARILEGLQFELERCVRQGADVDAIHDILANA